MRPHAVSQDDQTTSLERRVDRVGVEPTTPTLQESAVTNDCTAHRFERSARDSNPARVLTRNACRQQQFRTQTTLAELGSFPASSAREKAMRGCSSSSVAKARLELACRSRARRSERRASTNSATWPWGPVPASPRNSESSCASQPSLERRRGCSCFADQARPLAGSVFHFDDEAGRNRTFSKRIKSPPCSHYTTTSIVRWMRRFNR